MRVVRENHKIEEPAPSLSRVIDLLPFLSRFVRDPIDSMKAPLKLTWPAALSLQAGAAMLSGALAGVLSRNFWDFLVGLVLFPLSSVIIGFIFSGFFYYFFIAFRSTYLDYRRLHSIVVVATMPYFVLHAVSGFLAPIDLIGFALTSLLLIVGLIEQFNLDRIIVARLVGGMYAVFFVIWVASLIHANF